MNLYEQYLEVGDDPEENLETGTKPDPLRMTLSLIPKYFGLDKEKLYKSDIVGRAITVQKDGIFLVEKNGAGYFVSKVASFPEIKELTTMEEISEGFCSIVPKIPVEILRQTYAMFKDVCRIAGNLEAYVRILFNKDTQEFTLEAPVQEVTGGHVKFETSNYPTNISIIMEIHSHNTMDAFFSGTDNADETRFCGIYGVIGKINTDRPVFKWRVIANKKEIQLHENTLDLFDTYDTNFPTLIANAKKNGTLTYDKELLKNITDGSKVQTGFNHNNFRKDNLERDQKNHHTWSGYHWGDEDYPIHAQLKEQDKKKEEKKPVEIVAETIKSKVVLNMKSFLQRRGNESHKTFSTKKND